MKTAFLFAGSVLLLASVPASFGAEATRPAETPALRVLMFVGGVAHEYEALPRQLAERLKAEQGIDVRVTADLGELRDETLRPFDVIVFNTCLDTKLTEAQRNAIVGALRGGKGLVAVHCAFWSFQDWPEWRKMVGGLVLGHDPFGAYDAVVVDPAHPIAAGVPAKFTVNDEPYLLTERGDDIHVIVQTAGPHGKHTAPEPQVWTTRYGGGRVVGITFGHDARVQTHPAFLGLLANGIRWSAGRLGVPTMLSDLERQEGFEPLFDGKSLAGWKHEPEYWQAKDGVIIGNTKPKALDKYAYAIYEKPFGDFVLRWSVKLAPGSNSGMQFRSEELPRFEVAGYQADIVKLGWGNLHEQNGRRRLVDGWTGKAEKAVNLDDWNEMEVIAQGPHIVIKVNGVVTADYTEQDASRPRSGILALQLHKGEPTEVRFTNIRIKRLDK